MKKIKLIPIFVAASISMSVFSFETFASGFDNDEEHGYGVPAISDHEIQEYTNEFSEERSNYVTQSTLPTYVDLSASKYFPEIGDQGRYNSCISWATTYYQYTYEVNKLNDIATTPENTYSPRWTFNLGNGGDNSGMYWYEAYNILQRHGAVKNLEYPYNVSNTVDIINDKMFDWLTDKEAMVNALSTKVSDYGCININTYNSKITSPTSNVIASIKQLLANGKILEVNICGFDEDHLRESTISDGKYKNEGIFTSLNGYKKNGHAVTVVGYDDSVWCDLNGNGIKEKSECGAFKVANSWGKTYMNDGFFWVMYDALNYESAVPDVVNESGRTQIFSYSTTKSAANFFNYINVKNEKVNLIVDFKIKSNDSRSLQGTSYRTTSEEKVCRFNPVLRSHSENMNRYFEGDILIDFGLDDDCILERFNSNTWTAIINNNSTTEGMYVTSAYFIDNKLNTITGRKFRSAVREPGDFIQTDSNFNFKRGDVNYDGVLDSNDADYIMKALVMSVEFSDLQNLLGDYNKDGKVTIKDIVALNKDLPASEQNILSNKISSIYNSLTDTQKLQFSDDFDSICYTER